MMYPKVFVDVDGVPVSGIFFERLVSLNIIDREGIQSDSLKLVFSDAAPHFASPRRGAIVNVTILSGVGGAFTGAYVIDTVVHNCLPYTIEVSGHSADLRAEMKTNKSRHWDDASVKDIVSEIAGEYDLDTKISDAVSSHVYHWFGQQDESDLHFLNRLAKRHNALFSIKNGVLLWLERGTGKTANGTAIPAVTILPFSLIEGECRVTETDVDHYATVKAFYQDRAGSRRQEVSVDADPEAEGEHVIREPFSSEEEARSAAEAYAKEMLRGQVKTSCGIVGRPALMAGQPVKYLGVRPGVDGREFIADTVRHSYSKSGGLKTSFRGQLRSE